MATNDCQDSPFYVHGGSRTQMSEFSQGNPATDLEIPLSPDADLSPALGDNYLWRSN